MVSRVCFACNDPDNGQFTGRADSIEIDFNNGTVLSCRLQGTDIKIGLNQNLSSIKIGRLRVPIRAYFSWHGNWCWDSATVDAVDAIRLFSYLSKLKHWHCEEAPDFLFDAFNNKRPISLKDLDHA